MRLRIVLLGTLLIVLYSGIQGIHLAVAQAPDGIGFVRFAHTAIDAGPIDIYRSDSRNVLVRDLDYGQYSDFVTLPASPVGYIARPASTGPDGPILFKLDWGVKANNSDMIIACGLTLQKAFILEPLTIVRNATRGKARLRVFNTVWGGASLNIRTGQGVTLGQNLTYLKLTDADLDPGIYDFEISNSLSQSLVLRTGIKIEADKIYIMLIIGGKDRVPPVDMMIIPSDQETTRVKIVNKTAKTVDIYLKGNDQQFISGLSADHETDFITLPSGATTFVMRDAGSPSTSSVISSIATQLRPGRDVSITATTVNRSILMGITADVLSPEVINALQTAETGITITPTVRINNP